MIYRFFVRYVSTETFKPRSIIVATEDALQAVYKARRSRSDLYEPERVVFLGH